jgi:ubiquitin carboxyl-terminal hydrolase 5/13
LFNHPDDTGEVTSSKGNEQGETKAPPVPGSTVLPAAYRLKAFISHKGPSVHSGHYVAHVRMGRSSSGDAMEVDTPGVDGDDGWVLFNDEKVVLADRTSVGELKKLAYMYVFERV